MITNNGILTDLDGLWATSRGEEKRAPWGATTDYLKRSGTWTSPEKASINWTRSLSGPQLITITPDDPGRSVPFSAGIDTLECILQDAPPDILDNLSYVSQASCASTKASKG
jgi:hypothetical protein